MDLGTVLIVIALLLIGFLIGETYGSKNKKPQKPPEPICGCGHHLAYHPKKPIDDKTNSRVFACTDGIYSKPELNKTVWPCECQGYVGPVYADEFISKTLMPPVS